MQYSNCTHILIFFMFTAHLCLAQDKWVWSKTNDKMRDYQRARIDRDREPTTKRPILGQSSQNDGIDDYNDPNNESTKQYNPYLPNAGNPRFGGNYNGFGNYPLVGGFLGNSPNGVLIGPGGPTGVIGRPHTQYPGGVISSFPGLGQSAYPTYTVIQNFPGAAANGNPGFFNYNNGLGQYPGKPTTYPNPQQFVGGQYPQTQYLATQFPQQPQYTEGYGLAKVSPGFNVNSNFNSNYGPGYNDYLENLESKSAQVKLIDKKLADKVTKDLKRI